MKSKILFAAPSPAASLLLLMLLGVCQIPTSFALILKTNKPQHHLQLSANHEEQSSSQSSSSSSSSRRQFLITSAATSSSAAVVLGSFAGLFPQPASAALDLPPFQTSSSGLQWSDARVGSGNPLKLGSTATIDYVLSTTGARYGSKIYATKDQDMPYRWTLGDGSTITGIEQAILGDSNTNIPPMLPGGIRRVIIPQSLGYQKLAEKPKQLCVQDGQPGPIPPPNLGAFEEYQRFKNIYCNPDRQYQPDIVMDIKLYGARSIR